MDFKQEISNLSGNNLLEKVTALSFITATIALEYIFTHPASFLLTCVTLMWTFEKYKKERIIRKREEIKLKEDERTIRDIEER